MKPSSEDQKYWEILRKKTENEWEETDNAHRQKITAHKARNEEPIQRDPTLRELWEGEERLRVVPMINTELRETAWITCSHSRVSWAMWVAPMFGSG